MILMNIWLTRVGVLVMRALGGFLRFKNVKRLSLFLIIVLSVYTLSCNEDPPTQVIPILGKRDYTWTVDTLAYPGSFQTNMRSIWASSPKDVYVVGHNDRGFGKMYHYDGVKWSPVKFLAIEGGGVSTGPIDLSAVYGFASNDVWAVGEHIYSNPNPPPNFLDSSLIIHYDGSLWREIAISRGRRLTSIWGSNKSDVWFGGQWGSLYHFDGTHIIKIQSDSTTSFSYIKGFSSTNIFATASRKIDFVQPLDSSELLLYNYNGNKWKIVDSFLVSPQYSTYTFGYTLWASPGGNLYSSSYGVYLNENGLWKELFYSDWPIHVSGSGDQNIFAVGDLGRIYHWNGENWIRLTEIEDTHKMLYDVWTNNVETFIVGNDGLRTYIYHGK